MNHIFFAVSSPLYRNHHRQGLTGHYTAVSFQRLSRSYANLTCIFLTRLESRHPLLHHLNTPLLIGGRSALGDRQATITREKSKKADRGLALSRAPEGFYST